MDSKIQSKENMKVDKEKLSNYLKTQFMNEMLTTYYKLNGTVSFKAAKFIVEDLMGMDRK